MSTCSAVHSLHTWRNMLLAFIRSNNSKREQANDRQEKEGGGGFWKDCSGCLKPLMLLPGSAALTVLTWQIWLRPFFVGVFRKNSKAEFWLWRRLQRASRQQVWNNQLLHYIQLWWCNTMQRPPTGQWQNFEINWLTGSQCRNFSTGVVCYQQELSL